MPRKSFIFLFFVLLAVFSQNINAQENNQEYSVIYNEDFFYCGGINADIMIITINSKNEIDVFTVIRLEVYLRESIRSDTLIKISEKKIEMKQKNILISLPFDWDGDIMTALSNVDKNLYDYDNDYIIAIKIYINNVLISENNEIWIACATISP
jgi:hypothetical protein